MTDIAAGGTTTQLVFAPRRAGQLLAVLLALGLVSLAAILSELPDRHDDQCRAFTIGLSAIGGCDRIGGP